MMSDKKLIIKLGDDGTAEVGRRSDGTIYIMISHSDKCVAVFDPSYLAEIKEAVAFIEKG